MNRVELVGGLTRDPKPETVGGLHMAQMTVAVNGTRYDRDKGEQIVQTTFVTVQAWGLVAEELLGRYPLGKGDEVHVVGELDQQEIEKPDGTKDRKTRVKALHIDVLRCRNYQHPSSTSSERPPAPYEPPQSDEPPF